MYDVSDNVMDPNPLTYTEDSAAFEFSENSGILVPTADIVASTRVPLTGDPAADATDDPSTTHVDESEVYYTRSAGDGVFSNGQSATNVADDDVTYEFTVTVADSANTIYIPVELTIDVNEAPEITSAVTTDATTGALSYSGMAMVDDDARGVSILDLGTLVTDADGVLTFEISAPAPAAGETQADLPPELSESNGHVTLLFVPTGLETKSYTFVVEASDGYNPEDGVDETIAVTIDVTIVRPERAYPTLRINVDEEFTGDAMDENGNTVSVSGVIAGATEWLIIGHSGADGSTAADADGSLDFDVDMSTGVVSVVQARDADATGAILNPSLTVAASNVDGDDLGNVTVIFSVQGINETPTITSSDATAFVAEDAQDGAAVMTGDREEDVAYQAAASDPEGDSISWDIEGPDGGSVPFDIDSDGKITVDGNDALDHEGTPEYDVVITASDGEYSDAFALNIEVGNSNEAPYFVDPTLEVTIPEDTPVTTEIADYEAADTDNNIDKFSIKNQDDSELFALDPLTGQLTIAQMLDYEKQQVHLVEINVTDKAEATAEIQLKVTVENVNDNAPEFDSSPALTLSVLENTARGTVLANYSATDADGQDVTYSLSGPDAKSFMISDTGDLMTLESLDADRQVPCG
ncbi:MAG: cadherin repeat domain-containing protein, partial [Pseudomonadales bacterium]|nr:cadherin repeat domain-containing protein [Pseudomonadales bacterium]